MPPRNKAAKNNIQDGALPQQQDCYEGERLIHVLKSIRRGIASARALAGNSLPEKVWLKQQFAIGVNDVTRVLERMAAVIDEGSTAQSPFVRLQAILLAADCNPKWLMKHLPTLAKSRKVPLIIVKDDKKGSLRLGELVKLKTAVAIGVKARGSAINQIMEEILDGDEPNQRALLQVQ
ncbi:Ribosomal protein L7Ae/L30e/S12e/Gadd45 [Gossypium australe]|uniref:Ribosomal protein L7Ae/L30e/S12e/Gadd45 n=1 Tax=Gossypium australe TaxID=47621 RepID=A0A5B6W1E6_9ROSI|nr:Ribosomal protein L7Ae/L30e/S12e/Gadd45 [Gossypium australe]